MGWIGGPSKDLGEKEGSNAMVAVGSSGSGALQNAMSQAAQREASRGGNMPSGETPEKEKDSNEEVGEKAVNNTQVDKKVDKKQEGGEKK